VGEEAISWVTRMAYAAALKYACPTCKAVSGKPCTVGRLERRRPHTRRINLAIEAGDLKVG
jgi:hypothetical protein